MNIYKLSICIIIIIIISFYLGMLFEQNIIIDRAQEIISQNHTLTYDHISYIIIGE